ncbi:MAG: NUDIX hydrolase [Patescibacteria group bacterium]
MIEHESTRMTVRPAAKAVLYSGNDCLLVAGRSGRFNLPGGGIDDGETARTALYRELAEELGLEHGHLSGLEEAGTVEGIVTPRDGSQVLARWTIFIAKMVIPVQELIPGEDIFIVERVSRETALQYTSPHISNLALRTIQLTT